VLELLLRLAPAPPPELTALMAHPQPSIGRPNQRAHHPHYQPLDHALVSAGYHPLTQRSSGSHGSYGSGELVTTPAAHDGGHGGGGGGGHSAYDLLHGRDTRGGGGYQGGGYVPWRQPHP